MKKYINRLFAVAIGLTSASLLLTSCVDDIKFGNAFLEKAPGGTVTNDTVFNNPEYVKQYLTTLYSMQYYGLPYRNTSSDTYPCESANIYVGKVDALTDCYTFTYLSGGIIGSYYRGSHTSNYGIRQDKWHYLLNRVWEAVRYAWLLIEKIDEVPGISESEKASIVAQAKCIIASRYFDTFRHYGGIPIIKSSFSGTDNNYEMPRGSVEETVKFMTDLLDEAATVLPWTVENPATETGRWTRAAALALKCRILQFAASPLFNNNEPYYPGAVDNAAVWYGGYKAELWDQCLQACEEFFRELTSKGGYKLVEAAGTRPQDYRLAYRRGYVEQASTEILLSTRHFTTDAFNSSMYLWHQWGDPLMSIKRGYCPTQEYMEMFPWKDGTPFDWDKTEKEGKLDQMFSTGTVVDNNLELSRDPRLYEEIIVNSQPVSLDWTTGNMAGQSFEAWVGGTNAGQDPVKQTSAFTTGYAPIKFLMGNDMLRRYTQWPAIRLSDIYLTYAEALCQKENLTEAIKQIDVVRARVGMKGLVECNPGKNLTSDKNALIEEILRERACELGMEDSRFFDLIRYKRADIFEKQVHGLQIYRIDPNTGERVQTQWYGGDKTQPYPTHFEYEKYKLSNPVRYWWTEGFDPKWYLSPFPLTEVNKGYGLIQNPGW
jgi:SusD family.